MKPRYYDYCEQVIDAMVTDNACDRTAAEALPYHLFRKAFNRGLPVADAAACLSERLPAVEAPGNGEEFDVIDVRHYDGTVTLKAISHKAAFAFAKDLTGGGECRRATFTAEAARDFVAKHDLKVQAF